VLQTFACLDVAAACVEPSPSISLTPSSGISVITVTGSGFPKNQGIHIFWNGVAIPGWLGDFSTSHDGTFCAIMTIQTQTPGTYNITVTVNGKSASAPFAVLDTRGPQGPQGEKGEKGDTGATGPQGPKGDTGAQGPAGPQGDKGDKGEKGATGAQGLQGPKGDKGDTGSAGQNGSVWYSGSGKPSNTTGVDGDYYLNTYNGDVYKKLGSWNLIGNIRGAQGLQGPQGEQGPQGLQGEKGEKGDTGATGPQGPKGEYAALDILPLIIAIVMSSAAFLLSAVAFYRKKGYERNFIETDKLLDKAKEYI
jgi:hypothetical protein